MSFFRLSFGLRALYLSAFLLLAGNAIQNIFVPTHAVELGFSSLSVSLLGSSYFFGFIVGCLLVPAYLYRVGHVRTFSAFAALAAASALLIFLTHSIFIWVPLRLVTGFSLAALYLSVESWISASSENNNRGRVISVYRLVDITGSVIGQLVLFGMGPMETTLVVTAVILMISLIPITLTQIQLPVLVEAAPKKLKGVFRETYLRAPLSFWGALLSGMAAGIFWSLIPVFVVDLGHTTSTVPLVVSAYLIGGSLLQWPVGLWSDRIDRRIVISALSSLAVASALLLTLGAHQGFLSLPLLLLLTGCFGAGGVPIYAIAVAHANDWVKSASVVDLSVLLLLSSSVGSVAGPTFLGAILPVVGAKNFFLMISMTHGFLLAQGIYRRMTMDPMPRDQKSGYVDLPETTPMIATVISTVISTIESEAEEKREL